MSLKHGVLGLLNYGPMTGYELDKAFKESLNFFWQAQTSQIYRELKTMEKAGWLTSEIEIQTGKPNKILYSVTNEGKSELLNWLAKNVMDGEFAVRSEFLMKLFFSGQRSPTDGIEMLEAFKLECENGLNKLLLTNEIIERYSKAINDGNNRNAVYWKLTAEYGKAYAEMCLDFAEKAIKTLEGLK